MNDAVQAESQVSTASDARAAGGEASQVSTASDARAAGGEASQVSTASGWPELVSVALLGTERRDPPPLANPALAGLAAAAGAGHRSAEERLLSAAGSLAVLRRAGRLAPPAPPLPAPAPAEARPVCRAAAAYRLMLLLDDQRALLPEWLRAVARRGLRVPAERLPDLLEAATANQALRDHAEPVLGERGPWLAAQVPRWGWAAPLPATDDEREALWKTGTRPQRRRLFTLLRRSRPDEARQLLERGLSREEAADRAWFIGALDEGLETADEPLLESGLRDRSQDVRWAAARLLTRLPGSAFARRMAERTVPLVRVESAGVLRVTLPDPDEPTARDGIARRSSRSASARAGLLVQLVAFTPLSAWDAAGLTPELAATLPVSADFPVPLSQGLAEAAETQRDPRWAAALLGVEPRLAEIADPRQAASAALERLRAGQADIAERLPAPWPRELSEGALDLLVRLVGRGHWMHKLIAERLDPALADEAAGRLEGAEAGTARASGALALVQTLRFRREMHEELR
jgi:Family of unknown function (DUF5691)